MLKAHLGKVAAHPWRDRTHDKVLKKKLSIRVPEETEHIWDIFLDLALARNPGKAISFSEIKAWSDLTGVVLNAFEIELVRQLDVEFLHQAASKK